MNFMDLTLGVICVSVGTLSVYLLYDYLSTKRSHTPRAASSREISTPEKRNFTKVTREVVSSLFSLPHAVEVLSKAHFETAFLCSFNLFSKEDPDYENFNLALTKLHEDDLISLDKSLGCMMGLVFGDSLGAPLEFSPVRYGVQEITGFDERKWLPSSPDTKNYNRFYLKPGQWTDDSSMALCLADSLLVSPSWDPLDLRLRFLLWSRLGYNNAFGHDTERPWKSSVGLGGNISMSMKEFVSNPQSRFTAAGDKNTSGNGSIMRLAPVPIFYHRQLQKGVEVAYEQSKTTHQGDEAAECCRLMSFVLIRCISSGKRGDKETFYRAFEEFQTEEFSVKCLAASRAENGDPERNWQWKSDDFKYSPMRSSQMPGYIGSYCMDGMAMALHCIHTTSSAEEAILKAANLRGDSDTVAAIAGQFAGAIYGFSTMPADWIKTVRRWDPDDTILLRAYKMFYGKVMTSAQVNERIRQVYQGDEQ